MISTQDVEERLKGLPGEWIVMLEATAEDVQGINLAAVKALTGQGQTGIIVSANRPSKNLLGVYAANGIDPGKVFIIDCISKTYDPNPPANDHVVYVDTVSSMTSISIAFDEMVRKLGAGNFFLIDSLTTMLVYNKPDAFGRFIHGILTKSRMVGVNGFLASIEGGTNPEIRAELAQMCDKVFRIGSSVVAGGPGEKAEGESPSAPKFIFSAGESYLIESPDPSASLGAFKRLLTEGFRGLCVSSMNPALLRKRQGLDSVQFTSIWLSQVADAKMTVSPTDIPSICRHVDEFLQGGGRMVVLMLDIPLLRAQMDFKTLMSLLQYLEDSVSTVDCRLIVSLDPAALEQKELSVVRGGLVSVEDESLRRPIS
jgi:hypothetical protein